MTAVLEGGVSRYAARFAPTVKIRRDSPPTRARRSDSTVAKLTTTDARQMKTAENSPPFVVRALSAIAQAY